MKIVLHSDGHAPHRIKELISNFEAYAIYQRPLIPNTACFMQAVDQQVGRIFICSQNSPNEMKCEILHHLVEGNWEY